MENIASKEENHESKPRRFPLKIVLLGILFLGIIIGAYFIVPKIFGLGTKSDNEYILFDDGLLSYSLDGINYGYLDKTGNIVIDAKYQQGKGFNHGSAIVEEKGKFGVIDNTGKYVIQPIYEDLQIGSDEGNLFLFSMSKKYGYMDLHENIIITPQFDDAWPFTGKLNVASVAINDKYGVINKKGDYVVRPIYGWWILFNKNGYAGLLMGDLFDGKWGVIDSKGKIIVNPQYDDLFLTVSDNNYSAVSLNDSYGYINLKNEFVINPQFSSAGVFQDGFARVELGGEKYGVIDESGKYVIKPMYDDIGYFHENGIFSFSQSGKWGFINAEEKIIAQPIYEDVYPFTNELAAVQEKKLWGFINTKGEIVITPKFDNVTSFSYDGYSIVEVSDKFGVIDRNGKYIIEPNYQDLGNIREVIESQLD